MMDQLYDMIPPYTSELYPQQILPSTGECYNLPTPPRSPLTDLTLMGSRQYSMEPVQTMPTDLSMHEHNMDTFSDVVFAANEKDIWPADFGLSEFWTNSFDMTPPGYPLEIDNSIMADPEDYVPSPPPSGSPLYCSYNQIEALQQQNYISPPRSLNSVGYESDQDGSLSDDTTCNGQYLGHQNIRRQEDYYVQSNQYPGVITPSRPAHAQKKHNYRVRTDPISINDLNKSSICKKTKKKSTTSLASGVQSNGKISRKTSRGKGRREAMKGNHLWEFIRDLLKNKTTCPRIIRWENRQEGVFRFVNSEAVAGLWGSKKNNPNMNYEKLSRAMRYYYQRKILERVDGRRLVYKFGCNADGWREAAAELTEDE